MSQGSLRDTPLTTLMMGLHDDLAERFFAHQQALLDRDFGRATRLLTGYRERLLRHMRDEETLVLPLYLAAGGDATDAPVRLFLGEHGKMRDFVADFASRTARLSAGSEQPPGDPSKDRALLELLDRQATYKNLVLHHDLRERNALYPFLGARLSADEQARVLRELGWSGS